MVTRERQGLPALAGAVGRVALVAVFTGVETGALVAWLALVEGAEPLSRVAAVGLAALLGGLLLEHVLTDVAVNGPSLSLPGPRVLLVTASETALWALWLLVADHVGGVDGILLAGGALAVLLVPQHTVEDGILRGRGVLSRLLDGRTLGFSVVEAAGATAWLLLVREGTLLGPLLAGAGVRVEPATLGVGALALALLLEHQIGVAFARRP
jgi:hypothetical protein